MKAVVSVVGLFLLATTCYAAEPPASIDEALVQAKQQNKPVFVDFKAVWCGECYFMDEHVLTGQPWRDLNTKAVVYASDVDRATDRAWMAKLKIAGPPAFVVLGPDGDEWGRILGETPRDTFYAQVKTILAGDDRLARQKSGAEKGSLAAVATVLSIYRERAQWDDGLAWVDTLPDTVRHVSDQDKRVALEKQRLLLQKASATHDGAAAMQAATRVLAGDIGCDRPDVLGDLVEQSASLPQGERQSLLAAQRSSYERFLDTQIFAANPPCAGRRAAVFVAADFYDGLGDHAAEQAVLRRAIDIYRAKLHGDLKSDRDAANNVGYLLWKAKAGAELDDFEKQLVDAYPNDFDYAYQLGSRWVDEGRVIEGLHYLDISAKTAYGANAFKVARSRVQGLHALGKDDEARQAVADIAAREGKAFPSMVEKLQKMVKS